MIEDGISNLKRALDLDPDYDDAMTYMSLLISERAGLRDSAKECNRDLATAKEWAQRALETKKRKAAQADLNARPVDATAQTDKAPTGEGGERFIRVGSGVQEATLIRRVDPEYSPLVHQARIQGTVRFRAIIGRDGSVTSVELLNGAPVAVLTTIEVNFSLGN